MEKNSPSLTDIKLIVGLGNPGPRYHETRHNAGFMIIDALFEAYHSSSWDTNDKFHTTQITVPVATGEQRTIHLLKPMTGMNVSGVHIKPFLKKGIKPEQIVVCYDELEKPFGKSMIRFSGSARGHNGVRSTIEQIGDQFWQLRFGIGRPAERSEVGDYVLSRFSGHEQSTIDTAIDEAITLLGL